MARLYGRSDAAAVDAGRDADATTAGDAARDGAVASDAARPDAAFDAGRLDLDAGGRDAAPVDAGSPPLTLALVAALQVGGAPEGLAADVSSGTVLVAVTERTAGALTFTTLSGDACSPTAGQPTRVSIALAGTPIVTDLDGDGRLDLGASTNDTGFAFLPRDSGGGVGAVTTVIHGLGRLSAASAGHLDADATIDVAVFEAGARINLLLQGTPSWRVVNGPVGSGLTYTDGVTADLDGDGPVDLGAISMRAGPAQFSAIRGNGMGALFGSLQGGLSSASSRLAFGPLQVGATGSAVIVGGPNVWIGTVGRPAAVTVAPLGALVGDGVDVVLAQLDADPASEVVIADVSNAALRIFEWNAGRLRSELDVPLTPAPARLVALDTNGDGRDEIFALAGGMVLVLAANCP